MYTRLNQVLTASRAKRENDDKGFTLIELLVVVLIIGILSAIAIPVFLGQQASAQDSAAQSDLANGKTAMVAYAAAHNGVYAIDPTALKSYGLVGNPTITLTASGPAGFCLQEASASGTLHTYAVSDTIDKIDKGTCTAGIATQSSTLW